MREVKDTNIQYWLYVQQVCGAGSNRISIIKDKFPDIKEFYLADTAKIKEMNILTVSQLKRFSNRSMDNVFKIIEKSEKLGYDIITPDDERYPTKLINIPDPPAVLFVKGEFLDFDRNLVISIVGARKATERGRNIARELSNNLALAGAIIVSGGAVGIDSSAHIGAMRAKGKTVAVFPCGLNYPYLVQNEELREEISKNGCVISELPPDAPLSKDAFQIRNRLISGLASGIVVVEGEHRSGAKITVNRALEQGRDIFAVPGSPNNKMSELPNDIIIDGAIPVLGTYDILNEYGNFYYESVNFNNCPNELVGSPETLLDVNTALGLTMVEKCKNIKDDDDIDMSETAEAVLDAFIDTEEEVDDLIVRSELDSAQVLSALTELEMLDVVYQVSVNRYAIKEL